MTCSGPLFYPEPGMIAVMDSGERIEVWDDEDCDAGCFCGQLIHSNPPHINDVSCMWDRIRNRPLETPKATDTPLLSGLYLKDGDA